MKANTTKITTLQQFISDKAVELDMTTGELVVVLIGYLSSIATADTAPDAAMQETETYCYALREAVQETFKQQ